MLFTMSLFKGMKPPKNMDRWKGMESWLRIHYFDHLDTSSKNQEEENNQKEASRLFFSFITTHSFEYN